MYDAITLQAKEISHEYGISVNGLVAIELFTIVIIVICITLKVESAMRGYETGNQTGDVPFDETLNEALLHQQENGRWEWLKLKDSYFFGPNEVSICTFETKDETCNDRSQYLAAPVDAYGKRVRDKATVLKLLCLAAECEVDCDGSALDVIWHPPDASGNNWYVQTDECIDAIWDVIGLLQATYSIPDDGVAP